VHRRGVQRIAAGTIEVVAMKYVNLLLCSLSLMLSAGTARAEDPSLDEMVCALDPQCAMPFTDRRVRGVTATPSVRPPGSFDITLNFPFDSAELTSESRTKLDRVAKALTDSSTSKFDIIISGHTDARGAADYNQLLSERRAQAVRQFLITERGIDPKRLVAKGYGKTELLLPSDPNNDLNRRVQFRNSNYATASAPAAVPPAAAAPAAAAPRAQAPKAGTPKAGTPAARPAAPAASSVAEGDGL
jgi:outer membrane protein OmpA-like peptidoglycan-associated protein